MIVTVSVLVLVRPLASATVGLAGVVLGMTKAFDPLLGPPQLLYAFEAVIIGGLGSMWGTMVGVFLVAAASIVAVACWP